MRRRWRWGVALLVVGVLAALPSLIAARPVHARAVAPAALLAKIRASASVAWSGYGESRGGVALPDVNQLGDLTDLLGTTTRYRVWWHDQDRHREDALSLVGESDSIEDASGSWLYSSDDEAAVRVDGTPTVRLLQGQDLVAPMLGRRLAGTADVSLSSIAPTRVAGRSVPGLRLTPRHPAATTVAYVDLWADPTTGLTLRVDVQAKGQRPPVMRSVLLDVSFGTPSLKDASFVPQAGFTKVGKQDLADAINGDAPFVLPSTIGGLPRSALLSGEQGLATYGQGFGEVVLLPLPRDEARSLGNSLRDLGGQFQTPLLNGLLVQGDRRRYLVAGTVPLAVLSQISTELIDDPPPFRDQS